MICLRTSLINVQKSLLMIPVRRTMDDCKMNCGADSRKASKVPLSKASFFILNISCEFSGKLVSIIKRPMKSLKFLEMHDIV
jgi:hypothetical protein